MDKKSYERAVKKSVSMPGILFDFAETERRALGFPTMADYWQHIVRQRQQACAARQRQQEGPAQPQPQQQLGAVAA